MLTAGMLRDRAKAVLVRRTQTATGALREEREELPPFHFFRQTWKEQKTMLGKEQGARATMIIRCRRSPQTDIMTHYRHGGKLWRVDSRIPTADPAEHTLDITATEVNE